METNKIMEASCYYREEKDSWRKVHFLIDTHKVVFGKITVLLEKIGKIKIFPTKVEGLPKKITVKITTQLGN